MPHVKVKLIPPLDKEIGTKELRIFIEDSQEIYDILQYLTSKHNIQLIIDHNPNPGYIILLNDVDINVLEGLKTKVKNGDTITIIPVSHGG